MDTEFITGYTPYSPTRKHTHLFPCSSGSPAWVMPPERKVAECVTVWLSAFTHSCLFLIQQLVIPGCESCLFPLKKGFEFLELQRTGIYRMPLPGHAPSLLRQCLSHVILSPQFFVHTAGTVHNVEKGHSATQHSPDPYPAVGLRAFTLNSEAWAALHFGKNCPQTVLRSVVSKDWEPGWGNFSVALLGTHEYYSYMPLHFSCTISAVSKWEQQLLALDTARCICSKYEPNPNVCNAHHRTLHYLLLSWLQKPTGCYS